MTTSQEIRRKILKILNIQSILVQKYSENGFISADTVEMTINKGILEELGLVEKSNTISSKLKKEISNYLKEKERR